MHNKTPLTHKAKLRAQLITHAPEHLRVKRSIMRFWPLVAAPVAAVALFALATVWQPIQNPSNPTIQKVAGPLTAQKVFAQAIQYVDKQVLKPGEFYYTRSLDENTYNDKDAPNPGNTCIHTRVYGELFTNDQGIMERITRYDQSGRLYQLSTQTPDGRNAGPKFYWNSAIADAVEESVACPPVPQPEASPGPVDVSEYLSSPEHQVFVDINSGIPSRQKTALITLKSMGDYQVRVNQHIENYPKPVIALTLGAGQLQVAYYFDQVTKAYVGSKSNNSKSIIIEQDIRTLPTNDPPEYTRPSPPQR